MYLLASLLCIPVFPAQAANLTHLVNLFIGTASGANGGSGGNMFPGAAVPHAMAKVGIDVDTTPRQAGYIHDNSSVTGISLMHDEGTGGNTNGGYGFFPLFPLTGCSITSCPVTINARKALRTADADAAEPGYFSTTFVNGINIETTSTRRSGLIRFSYPSSNASIPHHVVVDLTNDLGRSFSGGQMQLDPTLGRVTLEGRFQQSYGPSNYTVFACYDFFHSSLAQRLVSFGTFNSNSSTNASIMINGTSLSFPFTSTVQPTQAGVILSFDSADIILSRFGVSFINASQACRNMDTEIPDWNFDRVRQNSKDAWETHLSRITVDASIENSNITELLYSSLYRSFLVPANLTDENPYWSSPYPFYDALFCSWDVFRTVHPLLSITAPQEWSEIVNAYIDGWRNTGFIPECRANTKPGYVQGGSDGMPILGDFAVKYGSNARELNVPMEDLMQALIDTAENTPPNWYTVGRQNTAWKQFGYIPTDWVDPNSTGLATREASRALEYALGDFAVRQAAKAVGRPSSMVHTYENRSFNFLNHWDPNVTSDGFSGFAQRRFANGSFAFSDPVACSPVDPVRHSCARGTDNDVGFYESSSWEMSFFVPHSMASVVDLMGGRETFVSRVDNYFAKKYFSPGNEPSFAVPLAYHYADRPDLSARRVRQVVFTSFNTGIGGIPGNDDSGAMAALLIFHILGLYPVPSSNQLLINSPMLSAFEIKNVFLGTTASFKVENFDASTLSKSPPANSRLYVSNVTINGKPHTSRCWIDFSIVFTRNSNVTISVTDDAASVGSCGPGTDALPDSLSTRGFS